MFMPQANPNLPARGGVTRTVVRWKAGSAALIPRSAKTTREVQSPLSCRSKTNSTGTPSWTRMTSGW
jgi:hypothetical protein